MKSKLIESSFTVGIAGTFDVNNYGDCLFPVIYRELLSRFHPNTVIKYYSPTGELAEIVKLDSITSLPDTREKAASAFHDLDAYILAGGETLSIGHGLGTYILPKETFSHSLRLWLAPLISLSEKSRPHISFHCVGAQAMPEKIQSNIGHMLSRCSYISVRDIHSRIKLEKANCHSDLAADPVLLSSDLWSAEYWQKTADNCLPLELKGKKYLLAQISLPYLQNDLSEWCDEIGKIARKLDAEILLLPICLFLHDLIVLKSAKKILKQKGINAFIVEKKLDVLQTTSLFEGCAGYVGSSLHGGVVALSFAKPFALLGKGAKGKHNSVMEALRIPNITAYNISEISNHFDNCIKQNMHELSDKAKQRALNDFHQLITKLRSPTPNRSSEIDITKLVEEICKLDRSEIEGVTNSLKRFLFKFTKNTQSLGGIYFYLLNKFRKQI
ncbi:hypothetical protein GUA87_06025 [Sneathiella sp. P13V-1]|uniref:polysaccharide pyruvyl transferase family protein n=1 Tax=Sneathiella sp. P13V-1 TaxID=2697366 RepID=UPI00187B3649|nr:polysaccharide pyruvyl transferase family protein [Sneathiella sp. P13V-1]MBE7636395.1 hypothetical protein [Sneathiella sp. P13V-1]